jgi:phospholipid/cholesterol/gamma-HCH transport system permease protein
MAGLARRKRGLPPYLFPRTRLALTAVFELLGELLAQIGQTLTYTLQAVQYLLKGQTNWLSVLEQLAFIGMDSLPIALILTTFASMVIALQVATEMARQGASTLVGALVALAMVRELAPVMSGFAVLALCGSAYAAELASMKSNNQLDALKVLHVDPVRYLFLPRFIAAGIALPLITVITTVVGILGGMYISQFAADIPRSTYLESVWGQLGLWDVVSTLCKAAIFGWTIVSLSCTIGLDVKPGGTAVGEATTKAVVWSFAVMALLDFVLSFVFYGSQR